MTACILATALVAAPALAQTSTAPAADRPDATGAGTATSGSPAMQPGGAAAGNAPTTGAAGATAPGGTGMGARPGAGAAGAGGMAAGQQGTADAMRPLAAPQPGQIMGSDVRGTRVYGANNESIGDINDILLDRNGQVVAIIVGVGGFLGIGQKDVAVPFQALEIVADRGAAGTTAGTAGTGTANPATTGSIGGASTAAGATGTMNPDRIVLRSMTRADLEAAPAFRSDGRGTAAGTGAGAAGTTTGTGTGAGAGTGTGGTAPRQ
jgi:hypothetical protein